MEIITKNRKMIKETIDIISIALIKIEILMMLCIMETITIDVLELIIKKIIIEELYANIPHVIKNLNTLLRINKKFNSVTYLIYTTLFRSCFCGMWCSKYIQRYINFNPALIDKFFHPINFLNMDLYNYYGLQINGRYNICLSKKMTALDDGFITVLTMQTNIGDCSWWADNDKYRRIITRGFVIDTKNIIFTYNEKLLFGVFPEAQQYFDIYPDYFI